MPCNAYSALEIGVKVVSQHEPDESVRQADMVSVAD